MYFTYMGNVLLPIAPKKFQLKVKNQNKTMNLIDGTEINFLKTAGLTELEFEVLIPAVEYSFALYDGGFKGVKYYTDHFEKLKVEKKPFQFIMVRQMPDGKILNNTTMTVSLESYNAVESTDEGFDTTVSIKLKQFNPFGTKTIQVDNSTARVVQERETVNSPAPKQEVTYTVKAGDCLWNIAKKFYGNGSYYMAINEANKDIIRTPNLIYPNQVLKIPDLASAKNLTNKANKAKTGNSANAVKNTGLASNQVSVKN